MEVLDTSEAMTAWAAARRGRVRVGLVPTMGFLHAGHASLLDLLRPRCEALVVSIYVNPLQFGAGEDLDRYPRDLEGDLALCAAHGADAVFTPASLYPPGHATRVRVEGLTEGLCGASRPVHFEGVTTVVARLFGLVGCDVAAFGEKDFQQLQVLRRMTADLALPVEIVGGPIVRDADGLALSSRNAYLDPAQRARALSLSRALRALQDAVVAGEHDVAALTALGRGLLDVDALDYLEVVDPQTLRPVARVDGEARALVAASLGATRLIDNVALAAAP
ncbi:MAG: pantoate--beta-alanine ligase [Alphaproteobacteria bacterium]|nr:pantoate--beta-alanine ligase [Alphaproteobacteria bacterium]